MSHIKKLLVRPLALILILSAALPALAQQLKRGAAPVSVETPSLVLVNQPVKITGYSVPMRGKSLKVSVRAPSGHAMNLAASIASTGAWSVEFRGARSLGEYRVTATSPDGKSTADTQFEVVSPLGMANQAADKTSSLLSAMEAGVPILQQQVAMLPASPGRAEALKRLTRIAANLREGAARGQELANALGPVTKLPAKLPVLQKDLQPAFDKMAQAAAGADAARNQLEEKLSLWGSSKPSTCDDLSTAVAGLQLYAGFVNFLTHEWTEVAKDIAEKYVLEKYKLAPSPLNAEDVMYAKSVLTTAHKSINYGSKWWAYNIDLTGKLTLLYQKNDGPGPIKVSGEFEGNAGNFKVYENLMAATPAMNRYVIFHLALPPMPALPGHKEVVNEFGKIGRTFAGPYSFLVPVHGIIDGNRMILQVDKATKDYGDSVKGRVWYVLVDPTSPLPIPYIMETDLPMVKAYFILSRGTHGKPIFTIETRGDRSTIEKTFNRRAADAKGNYKVVWKVDIKACNPECE
ncbi:MAG: hypothetical protein P8018_12820 [Acidobacteriota bacterium]